MAIKIRTNADIAEAQERAATAHYQAQEGIKAFAENAAKRLGRPPSGKVRVTMLLRPETVEKFKAIGKGWQARMSDILDRNAP